MFKTKAWCRIHTLVGKVEARSSCALALVRAQEVAVARDCNVKVSIWPGNQAVNLGKRRWTLSALEDQTVEVSCPMEERHVISVPALGVLRVTGRLLGKETGVDFPRDH